MSTTTKEQKKTESVKSTKGDKTVAMVIDFPPFHGAPTTADVHPDEVEIWKASGWRIAE